MDSSAPIELAWEKGPLPCVVQDWRTGEVLTVAYMDGRRCGARARAGEMWFWSRSRQELWHKGETSGNVQRAARAALGLRRRRAAGAGRAGRPGLPHRRAHLLPQRRRSSPRPARRWARSSGRSPSARARPRRQLHRASCWPTRALRRREGARGGGGGGPRGARGVRRARGARRPPTCSTTWPCCWPRAASAWPTPSRCSMTVAAEPAELRAGALARRGARARARPHARAAAPHLHRRLRDAGVRLPEAARRGPVVPARVGRAGPALRPLVVPRRSARAA